MNIKGVLFFMVLIGVLIIFLPDGFTDGYYTSDGSYVSSSKVNPVEIEKQKQEFYAEVKQREAAGEEGEMIMQFEDGTVLRTKYGGKNSFPNKAGKFVPLIIVGALLGAYFLFLK